MCKYTKLKNNNTHSIYLLLETISFLLFYYKKKAYFYQNLLEFHNLPKKHITIYSFFVVDLHYILCYNLNEINLKTKYIIKIKKEVKA